MIELYHGSMTEFDEPDPSRGKMNRDFGVGFYLAENINDAISIALKKSWKGYLYTYELDDDALFRDMNCIEFCDYDDGWMKFVYDNRMEGNANQEYDCIVGPTAGGCVNDLFDDYRRNDTPFDEAVVEMSNEITDTRFGIQWCLTNDTACNYLTLIDVEEYERD